MARTAAAKKVAKAASTGAAGKGFKVNRSLLFPGAMALVVIIGVVFVFLARDRRADNAFDFNQDWFLTYDFYECDGYLNQTYLASDPVDDLPIEAQGDGLIHVQPFHGNVTDATGTVGAFMAAVQTRFNDDVIELPDGRLLTEVATGQDIGEDEGCAAPDGEGDRGSELRVLRWNSVDSPLPVVFADDLSGVRLNDNGQVVTFALVHPDQNSTEIPIPDTTALRLQLGLDEIGPIPGGGGTGDGESEPDVEPEADPESDTEPDAESDSGG